MSQNLRVALVWNGTVFQEKTFDRVSSDIITVGDSRENDFTVPADGLPETFEMFKRINGGYVVRFTDALEGKVHYNKEDHTIAELIDAKGVTKVGSEASVGSGSVTVYEATLTQGDWGVLMLGKVSIFFQFVDHDVAPLYRPPFTREMIEILRPATPGALMSWDMDQVIGMKARRDLPFGKDLRWTDLED